MISAIVLTKNEERNIKDCITSLLWCDEVIVIDDNSIDKTLSIINHLSNDKIKVFHRSLQEDFSSQRNYALQKAKGEWIFFIDADEIVSPSLQFEVMNTINSNLEKKNGYILKRKDFMWGRTINHGESTTTNFLRLARKGTGEWVGKVHEVWKVSGSVGHIQHVLEHYPHKTIAEFLKEINYYTNIRAIELYTCGKKVSMLGIVFYTSGKFLQNYFLRRGFLDGIPGLILAYIMSFHSFLVRGKLWLLWQQHRLQSEK
jgi:glycosyltransferase involved in cell wall biosynthesis